MRSILGNLKYILIVLIGLSWHCKQSTQSTKTTVTIDDIWLSDYVDNDEDGYWSNADINIALSTNKSSVEFFVVLGIRSHDSSNMNSFTICFTSVYLEIKGDTEDNIWYIPINAIDYVISEGGYVFIVQVFLKSNPDEVMDESSPSTDLDLSDLPLEPSSADLLSAWISYIDDDTFEGYHTYYPSRPLRMYYTALAERFEKPADMTTCLLKKVRIHLPHIYTSPTTINVGLSNDENDEPKNSLMFDSFDISSTRWNVFDFEYDLTDQDIFYITVGTSINYAVSIDTNSTILNGYAHWYAMTTPPSNYWKTQERNYGIEVFVEYSTNEAMDKSKSENRILINKFTHFRK